MCSSAGFFRGRVLLRGIAITVSPVINIGDGNMSPALPRCSGSPHMVHTTTEKCMVHLQLSHRLMYNYLKYNFTKRVLKHPTIEAICILYRFLYVFPTVPPAAMKLIWVNNYLKILWIKYFISKFLLPRSLAKDVNFVS